MGIHSFFGTKVGNSMFPGFFTPYLNKFDYELSLYNKLEGRKIETSFKGVHEYLYTSLLNYSIRALIRELHIYKDKGLLVGQSSNERFTSFEKIVESDDFKKEFFLKYPVLDKLFKQKVSNTLLYVYEIIKNFNIDKIELEKTFGKRITKIIDIHLGKGDTHNGGKTVAIIEFDSLKIVYKPHNLFPDVVFENIIDWINLNERLKCKLNVLKILNRDEYGWQEFINYCECKNKSEVENYYYRSGCFLAIFYILGTNDIHYENVIANGENPCFVDLETLAGTKKFKELDSVLTTGFIPNNSANQLFDVDLSGLCGKMQTSSKLNTIVIANPRTEEMKIETQPARIYSNSNIAKLNNSPVKIEDFTDNFVLGFQETVSMIVDNKDAYIYLIEKEFNKFQRYRQLLRHTQVYAKFLIAASHPDYLQSETKHRELFQVLYNSCKDENEQKRVSHEISVLLKWDVPYYYCYYDSRDLLSDNMIIDEDYFKFTLKDTLYNRINLINHKVNNFQIDTIRKSLFTAYEDPFMKNEFCKIDLYSSERVLDDKEVIIEIADSISKSVLEVGDNDEVALLINTVDNNKVLIAPMNFNLYEGGGIIWLFACIGKLFGSDYYHNISLKLLELAVSTYEYSSQNETNIKRISAFSGLGSLMYLYYNLSILFEEEELYCKFTDTANKILYSDCSYLERSNESFDYEFISGISSLVLLSAKIFLHEKNDLMVEIIDKYSYYLLKYIKNNDLKKMGLAHGLSGYALTLVMIYCVKKEQEYLDLAIELINKENILYYSNKESNKMLKTSWCNGETGMALARNEILKIKYSDQMLNDTLMYLKTVVSSGFYNMNSMCLCHGIYGNIEVANKIINNLTIDIEDIITVNQVNEFEKRLINNLQDIQLGLKNNFMMDTFMVGTSGIAYAKLKHLYPQLPSILSLDILEGSGCYEKKDSTDTATNTD